MYVLLKPLDGETLVTESEVGVCVWAAGKAEDVEAVVY